MARKPKPAKVIVAETDVSTGAAALTNGDPAITVLIENNEETKPAYENSEELSELIDVLDAVTEPVPRGANVAFVTVDELSFLDGDQNMDGGISDEDEAPEVKYPVVEETAGEAVQETPVLTTEEIKDETPAAPNDDEDKAANESEAPAADDRPTAVDAPVVPPVVEDLAPADVIAPPVVETPAEDPEVVGLVNKPIGEWTLEECRGFVRGELKKPGSISEREVVERARTFLLDVCQMWERWGVEDIYLFLKNETRPVATTGGFYKNDSARLEKKAVSWTREELVDFLKGELPESVNANECELYENIVIKWNINPAWNRAEVKDFVLFNRKPELSANGYWYNDVVREAKPAVYWTKNELSAFASGEIPATDNATEDALYGEIRIRFDVSDSYSNERIAQLLADYTEEELPMPLLFVKSNLEKYKSVMGPGAPVSEGEAGQAQSMLYSTISRVLRLEGRQFVDGWTMILDFVSNNRNTMFSERNSYRGIAVVQLSDRDRRNHEQLLNLIIKTSAADTRYEEAAKTNFSNALEGITDEQIRQRVFSYYQINV